ncbi:MAG: bifunctional 3,4-dihydroxy-2-butanone-4-phosphate synthase/GTP cyclohydrolase II [Candidatus Eisenbacteria bacterium]|uniref:Riboflavin biosynthesis protein RibBA n=1 Tax=Eiseniibacteriota bacterium TaxID=2212470 RepID=A0A948RXS1_UNCEI|nr:bifunctional 3,4-dihydroxy-2-butanone-4-phosphate synthase/GTP cyclohydrolase II [Candidatus Eisenbacteria bacterium]
MRDSKDPEELNSIEEAIEEIRAGRMLIVVDDEDRENEGDFIMAGDKVTPEAVNFMSLYGRGLICVPLAEERLKELDLHPMVSENTSKMGTSFTVSVDAVRETTTGISAQDRAVTIRTLLDPRTRPQDLARPGHIFPLRAAQGGVLRRAGHTEAAVDLARLAQLTPAGVLCEIMNEDGSMARLPHLRKMAKRFDLKIISVASLIQYRRHHDQLIRKIVRTHLPTRFGDFELFIFRSVLEGDVHVALVKGDVSSGGPVLVRVHSQCLTGDVLESHRCDCGEQKDLALERIGKEGRGVFLYMRQEGRGIGLENKIRAYHLQDQGLDTVEANLKLGFRPDERDYGIGAQILAELGVREIRLMTNNPKKRAGLEGYGLKIVERIPLEISPKEENRHYLETKRTKLGHLFGSGHDETLQDEEGSRSD